MTDFVAEMLFWTAFGIHNFLLLRNYLRIDRHRLGSQAELPPFTIIVCAKNELTGLRKLIPKLLNQDYPQFEIVIALDRCTDGSQAYLASLNEKRLKCVEIAHVSPNINGKKYGLKQAILRAKTDWLLFTDGDCVPASDNWITSFANQVTPSTSIILGLGAYETQKEFISVLTEYETFQTALNYLAAGINKQPYMGVGRNMAYRKSTFLDSQGFDSMGHITGGDDDLLVQKMANSKNTAINYGKESLTYSPPKRTWLAYVQQKTRHLSVGRFYKKEIKTALTVKAFAHALLWLSFLYLIFYSQIPLRVPIGFCVMIMTEVLIFRKVALKTGLPFQPVWFLFVDFFYAILLPLIGIRSLSVKNIEWKK